MIVLLANLYIGLRQVDIRTTVQAWLLVQASPRIAAGATNVGVYKPAHAPFLD